MKEGKKCEDCPTSKYCSYLEERLRDLDEKAKQQQERLRQVFVFLEGKSLIEEFIT